MLGITYKSAWFMAHRVREAMKEEPFQRRLSGVVEADETYVGGKERNRKRQDKQKKTGRGTNKTPVVTLVERGGQARSFRMANVTGEELKGAIRRNVDPSTRMMTDAWRGYAGLATEYASHEIINHGDGVYGRGDVHTNTAENYFSILKRGINGIYHHVSEAQLPLQQPGGDGYQRQRTNAPRSSRGRGQAPHVPRDEEWPDNLSASATDPCGFRFRLRTRSVRR
jgi:hypothetical protein